MTASSRAARPSARLHTFGRTAVCANNVHIGDFVEIKNSTVGKGTSVSHLTYVGDSDVGKYVQFRLRRGHRQLRRRGRSTATPSGIMRSSAAIRTWWRPVSVGDGAYTAAGSTITDDVPAGALGIARARQVNKPQWANGQAGKVHRKAAGKGRSRLELNFENRIRTE